MLRIDDLKRRRNEWLLDSGYESVMLDSADFIHRVSRVWIDDVVDRLAERWVVTWCMIDHDNAIPHTMPTTFPTRGAAIEYVDVGFCDHFQWFEAAA